MWCAACAGVSRLVTGDPSRLRSHCTLFSRDTGQAVSARSWRASQPFDIKIFSALSPTVRTTLGSIAKLISRPDDSQPRPTARTSFVSHAMWRILDLALGNTPVANASASAYAPGYAQTSRQFA